MSKLSISEIKQRIPLPEYIGQFAELRKNGKEYECCCLFHNEKTPSMRVYWKKGQWSFKCFGCGVGGSLIDFAMEYHCLDTPSQAINYIMTGNGEARERKPEIIEHVDIYADFDPLPLNGRRLITGQLIQALNPKRDCKIWHMRPDSVYPYENGFVARMIIKGKKLTPTIRWCRQKSTGLEGWVLYPFREGEYTFYGELKPTGQVIIVEGEKAVDAGMCIFNGSETSVISWAGGTNRVDKTDWSALLGRRVIGLPDNDKVGFDVMNRIKETLTEMTFIDPSGMPAKWDIADTEFTRDNFIEWAMDRMTDRLFYGE